MCFQFCKNENKSTIGEEIIVRLFEWYRCKHCYLRFVGKESRDTHQALPYHYQCQKTNNGNQCQRKYVCEEERDDHQTNNCNK